MISFFTGLGIGFIIGLIVVKYLLRSKTKEELRQDKTLHRKYGGLVWLIALLGGALGVAFDITLFLF